MLYNDFLVTSLLIVMSPGTGAIITLSAGLRQGKRSAIIAAAGCTLGVLPHMLAAVTGLAALLHASPLLFSIVKYTGVAYLLFMAWQTLRDKTLLTADGLRQELSPGTLIIRAVVANLLNPKLSLFFLAFLPQFIASGDVHPTQSMLILSAIFAAMTFAVFSLYGAFASSVSHYVLGNPRVMTGIRWGVALAFTAVGIRLAMAVQ
ncbi:lysine transporter LysE [Kosakonia radicincitans DSM 16656]|uniref:LysE family translocator n=1 Tax=Kosakonia radicincitans TaxID=283686 RepID=UPI000272DA61|nr:LysE family translocator [Kosakonia radicincitans]ARD63304.1 lysine transporter LysE [Kosakonia radicincitans DSM 16656]